MELCTHRHLCSSLGCHFQPFEDVNRTGATPLCQCDPDCVFFNDCCQDYNETCEPWTVNEEPSSHLTGLQVYNMPICGFFPRHPLPPLKSSKKFLRFPELDKDTYTIGQSLYTPYELPTFASCNRGDFVQQSGRNIQN